MRYRTLGRTGFQVSELCLGTMTFGDGEGAYRNVGALALEDAERLLRIALDAGVNLVDTADIYAAGRSEAILGQALRNLGVRREEVVIATKVFGPVGKGPNDRGASRGHILDAVKRSLARLQVDHIDLYQIHGFDPLTPIEETLRALDLLVRQGLVRYVGVSNWAAWQVARAIGLSERFDLARVESVQAYYTIATRDIEREILPMLLAEGVGLLVWSPLAGGLLSGKFDRSGQEVAGARRTGFDFPPVDRPRAFALIDAMRPIADERGVSVAQVALAWLLGQAHVTSVIIGARRPEQLVDNLAAVRLTLSEDERAALDLLGAPAPEYPGWMLTRQSGYRAASD